MDNGVCSTCAGVKLVVIGVIMLANAYWPFADWWVLAGILVVLMGLVKIIKPTCPHCTVEMAKPVTTAKPAKKR